MYVSNIYNAVFPLFCGRNFDLSRVFLVYRGPSGRDLPCRRFGFIGIGIPAAFVFDDFMHWRVGALGSY